MGRMFKSAVIILVSNDTLTGKSRNRIDEFLISQLVLLNFEVKKLLVVNDCEYELEHELSTHSKQYDIILVVGKLENNRIFRALGKLFCDDIKINHVLKLTTKCDELAMLPPVTKLLRSDVLPFPVIYIQRIFILKEEFAETQFFDALKYHLQQYVTQPIFKKIIKVQMNGNSKMVLDNLSQLANIDVHIEDSMSNITVASQDFEKIVECEKLLKHELKESFIGSSESIDLITRIYESPEEHIVDSLKVIEECLTSYGPDNIFLSFNGGKDCTVLLHLVYTVLKIKYPDYKKPILCLYINSKKTFEEQDDFISQCQIFYNLDLLVITSNIKTALSDLLVNKPHLKAVFMGTRRTDPYSQHLNTFQMTDPDWPQIMRVNPLLDWHYSDIWDYLLFFKVPYCKLYNLGYTSLGSSLNTIRNPSLKFYDINQGKNVYLPAYKLINESEERSGRNVNFS